MKSSASCLALLAALALTAAGCNSHADEAAAPSGAPAAMAEAVEKAPPGTVRTAVAPSGEVIYIVAVCGAGETCTDGHAPCKTAQCWKDSHGRQWCAKPLKKECCKDGKAEGECYRKSDGSVMAVEDHPGAVSTGQCRMWCVKAVKPCPKKFGRNCGAAIHVSDTDHHASCAPADVRKEAGPAAQQPAPMADAVVEDDYFIVSAF